MCNRSLNQLPDEIYYQVQLNIDRGKLEDFDVFIENYVAENT